MQNIINYFNVILDLLFNQFSPSNRIEILRPTVIINRINDIFSSAASSSPFDLGYFLCSFFKDPSLILSSFVWSWFAWLTIYLLLIWPFNWLRSVIRKCRG